MDCLRIWFTLISLVLASGCALPSNPLEVQSTAPIAPEAFPGAETTDVLIYAGAGSWAPEIDSLSTILFSHGVTYEKKNTAEMNSLTQEDLAHYRMILFPGGDAIKVTQSLTKEVRARLRTAIRRDGLNYIGFCAGAWLAIAPEPERDEDQDYGLRIIDGPIQELNFLSKQGKTFAIDQATFADGTRRKALWYGGPITPDVPGGVIARYSDGTPAITQLRAEKGFVIISGIHPAATGAILESLGLANPQNVDAIAPEFAWKLLEGALHQKPLPAF